MPLRLATRNLLAELILDALDSPRAATAVRCLAAYARTGKRSPPVVSPGQLLAPAPVAEREQVRRYLEGHSLLSWRRRGPVRQDRDRRRASAPGELDLAVRKGVLLFNHRLFFEVHEVLEAQWVQEVDPERRFLQGLIQIAVAFYHLGNHNLGGALSLLDDGLDKIRPHAPAYLGLELSDFVGGLERCGEEMRRPQGLERFQDACTPSLQHTES